MVITNWGYTQNFEGVIELMRNCGGNELKTPFLSSPKNTLYISPVYISKYIGVIDDYLMLPLLALLREKHLTSITDETTSITFIEQVVLYATFEHNKRRFHETKEDETKEDFIGINPISKVLWVSLSAGNIMKSLEQYFLDHSNDMSKARFACMDTANVNSRERGA